MRGGVHEEQAKTRLRRRRARKKLCLFLFAPTRTRGGASDEREAILWLAKKGGLSLPRPKTVCVVMMMMTMGRLFCFALSQCISHLSVCVGCVVVHNR